MNSPCISRPAKALVGTLLSLGFAASVFAAPFNGDNGDFTYTDGANTAIPTFPGGSDGTPLSTGGVLDATGGDVSVTYLGYGGAEFYEYLFIQTPGGIYPSGTALLENHFSSAGQTVDLGTFTAGTEVEFGIFVNNTGNTWYDGPGSRNGDGAVHAYTVDNFGYTITNSTNGSYVGDTGSGTYVGFEDESYPGGDFNYADLQFVFSGVEGVGQPGQPSGVPDGGSACLLLSLGLGAAGAFRRKLKQNARS